MLRKMRGMYHPDIAAFEARTSLTPTDAAVALGLAYPTYTAYRAQRKPVARCVQRHLRTLLLLPDDLLRLAVAHG